MQRLLPLALLTLVRAERPPLLLLLLLLFLLLRKGHPRLPLSAVVDGSIGVPPSAEALLPAVAHFSSVDDVLGLARGGSLVLRRWDRAVLQ